MIAPLDVELYSVSAGGAYEPKADWTEAAERHMRAALQSKAKSLGLASTELSEDKADEFAELLRVYAAVARAISIHHAGSMKLPTKEDRLDWSFGDCLQPLQQATGARYALFTWVRDSYASNERKAMMVGMALLGVGLAGGVQTGYALLVDLQTGQVLWFNELTRVSGDLREAQSAAESVLWDLIDDELSRTQYDESIDLFKRLVARRPRRGDLRYGLGEARRLRGQGDDPGLALDDFVAAVALDKPPAQAWRGLGFLHRQQGRNADAVAAFKHYLVAAPDAPDAAIVQTYVSELTP
jgi:tetratricopeptide (TPR) repeat protein